MRHLLPALGILADPAAIHQTAGPAAADTPSFVSAK